jgi:two-component system response regulator NreC
MQIKILVADDHGVLRAGLRALLNAEPDLSVVGEAASGEEALKIARKVSPDIVLMDLNMPGMGGIEAARKMLKAHSQIRVLILTVHEDNELLKEAIKAGASGYILKRAVESELIYAIHAVMRGDLYIHSAMTRALLSNQPEEQPDIPDGAEELTPREQEVLRLIAEGHTNRQIADLLSLSVRTVESHRSNLMEKLNLHSRVELVRYAHRNQLLN